MEGSMGPKAMDSEEDLDAFPWTVELSLETPKHSRK